MPQPPPFLVPSHRHHTQAWLLASTNAHKAAELEALLASLGVQVAPSPEALEVAETAPDFAGNAALKALAYAKAFGQWALADDSGLAVAALDGRPGVLSARYAPTDAERIARLLGEMEGVGMRDAAFVCALALASPTGELVAEVVGCCPGAIALGPRGANGFGYDPIFELPSGKTFAELSPEEKLQEGHRGRAGRALAALLQGA